MRLVWHSPLKEAAWFLDVLGDIVSEQTTDAEAAIGADDCIHVVSSNIVGYGANDEFFRALGSGRNVTLLHASDEWFSGGYKVYRHFDRVLRTHETWLARNPGIATLPLGYPNGLQEPTQIRPAAERANAWFFAGEVKASRHEMVRGLRGTGPALFVDTREPGVQGLDRDAYRRALENALFVPCPMGNVMAESWRLYEGLEFGCVPLIEKRLTIDYYHNALGPNPIPAFSSWQAAGMFIDQLSRDAAAMQRLQDQVTAWWTAKKADLRRSTEVFMRGPSHRKELQAFADMPRNRSGPLHEALRMGELVRHQTLRSLARRVANPAKILARIQRERA